jgi:hypothetical protein
MFSGKNRNVIVISSTACILNVSLNTRRAHKRGEKNILAGGSCRNPYRYGKLTVLFTATI